MKNNLLNIIAFGLVTVFLQAPSFAEDKAASQKESMPSAGMGNMGQTMKKKYHTTNKDCPMMNGEMQCDEEQMQRMQQMKNRAQNTTDEEEETKQ